MPQVRLYIDSPFEEGVLLSLSPDQGHYLMHVMRLQSWDPVHVFNGRNGEWCGAFQPHKRTVHILLKSQVKVQVAQQGPGLIFSPLKPKRLEFLVEKATELEVQNLYPATMDHTSYAWMKVEKIQSYAIEAAEQSERLTVPEIAEMQKLPALLKGWDPECPVFWAAERSDHPPLTAVLENVQSPTFLIGPEGGFSEKEVQLLQDLPFVIPVSLGATILRAETAALMCLSLWRGGITLPTP